MLIRHALEHPYVLRNFIARDLKVKYRGTVLGYLWSLLEPMSLVLVYYFVFVIIAQRGGPTYPLTVILGVLPYTFFSSVVTGGAGALYANRGLIRRVYLPRELFVLGHLGSQLVVLLLSLLAVIPFLIAYRVVPDGRVLLLLPALVGLAALAAGLALVLCCANVLYRDVGYLLRVVLRLGFYASPVIYPLALVPEDIRGWYLLNPVAVWITMIRSGLTAEPIHIPMGPLALSFGIGLGVLLAGAALFQRWQARAVKYL